MLQPGTLARKKKKLDNFKAAVGMRTNWADLDRGLLYYIQEYAEALNDPNIPRDKKPTKIKVAKLNNLNDFEWVDELLVEKRMRDPEPDPRY